MAFKKTKDIDWSKLKRIVVDTNVLLYIYAGTSADDMRWASKYNSAISEITNNDVKIVLTDVQISEITNALLQRRFKDYNNTQTKKIKYKDFRKTPEFRAELKSIEVMFKKLFVLAELDNYENDEAQVMNFFKQSKLDYNDVYYVSYARLKSIPIITNDSDYSKITDVPVYSEL